MGLFSGLFGGGKDTSFSFDYTGLDNAIAGVGKYAQAPTDVQRGATAQQEMAALDQRAAVNNSRRATGASNALGSQDANKLVRNMSYNNQMSSDAGGKYGMMASQIGDDNITKQDNQAYDTATRILPNYTYKKQQIQTGQDLGNMQADADAQRSTIGGLADLGMMAASMYGNRVQQPSGLGLSTTGSVGNQGYTGNTLGTQTYKAPMLSGDF